MADGGKGIKQSVEGSIERSKHADNNKVNTGLEAARVPIIFDGAMALSAWTRNNLMYIRNPQVKGGDSLWYGPNPNSSKYGWTPKSARIFSSRSNIRSKISADGLPPINHREKPVFFPLLS